MQCIGTAHVMAWTELFGQSPDIFRQRHRRKQCEIAPGQIDLDGYLPGIDAFTMGSPRNGGTHLHQAETTTGQRGLPVDRARTAAAPISLK